MKKKIDDLLTVAYRLGASDIHMTVGVPPVFRIHGDLNRYGEEVVTTELTTQLAEVTIPERLHAEYQEKGQIDYSYDVEDVARFRVNAYQQQGAVSIAFRAIPSQIPTLDELKLPEILKKLAETQQGLILITGPTGSGKSTTLAAMVNYINDTTQKHIITLEDPIEYRHSHRMSIIEQREVGLDTGTFQEGLRAALRQDPDIILVGELRDLETIATAITAAETGHLVLATLHTRSAAATINRIIDVFPHGQQGQIRVQLASVLTAVFSQRLLQTTDKKGRRAGTELLINTAAVANMIRTEKVHQLPNVIQTNQAIGMHLMEFTVKKLLDRGEITPETAKPFLEQGDS